MSACDERMPANGAASSSPVAIADCVKQSSNHIAGQSAADSYNDHQQGLQKHPLHYPMGYYCFFIQCKLQSQGPGVRAGIAMLCNGRVMPPPFHPCPSSPCLGLALAAAWAVLGSV